MDDEDQEVSGHQKIPTVGDTDVQAQRPVEGRLSAIEQRLQDIERNVSNSSRRWYIPPVISALGVAVSFGALLVSYLGYSARLKYEEHDVTPRLELEKEQISYVHPGLAKAGPTREKDMLIQNGTCPRWFSYEAEVKNLGTKPLDVRGIWIGISEEGSSNFVHQYELERRHTIEPGSFRKVRFLPRPPVEGQDPFPVQQFRIYLLIECTLPEARSALIRIKLGGFNDDKPVIVREGTEVPEGTAAVVDFEFYQPAIGTAPKSGQAQLAYQVFNIPEIEVMGDGTIRRATPPHKKHERQR